MITGFNLCSSSSEYNPKLQRHDHRHLGQNESTRDKIACNIKLTLDIYLIQ